MPIWWLTPIVLGLGALGVAVVQQVVGVRVIGYAHSDDGSFAIQVLRDFLDGQAQGAWLPRWSASANGGLGGPIFYFYPPGAYTFASLLAHLLPGQSEAGIIAASETCFRALSVLTCAAWLRTRVSWSFAVLGGTVYALMPYVALVNPQFRLAFAETASGVLLPLVFLAVDLGRSRPPRTVGFVAPVMAALVLTHLPMAVLAGGFAVAYAAFCAGSLRLRATRAASAMAGVLLGLALAGFTLVPALLLQQFSQLDLLDAPYYDPTTHFLFTMHFDSKFDALVQAAIFVPIACAVLAWAYTRRRPVPGLLPLLATLAVAVFMLTPLSRVIWVYVPFLRHVQFPSRLGLPISLLGAAALGLAAAARPGWLRPLVLVGGVALAAALGAAAWDRGDQGRPESERTRQALSYAETSEYISGAARVDPEWQTARFFGVKTLHAEAAKFSGCHGGRVPAFAVTSLTLVVEPGCQGRIVLPHFFFPGWTPQADAPPLQPDPVSGLISIASPAPDEMVYERKPFPEEKVGLALSLVALGVWAIVLALALTSPRRAQRR